MVNKQRFFSFGCSFTSYKWPTWADILSKDHDEFYNYGCQGAGNFYIFNAIVEANLKHSITSDDLVVVMWTNVSREDRYVKNRWITPGSIYNQNIYDQNFVKKFSDERGYYIRDLSLIYAADCILKQIGCRYIFASMMDIVLPREYVFGQDFLSSSAEKNIADLLEYYKDTVSKIKPSVHKVVFDYDWCSRPLFPEGYEEIKYNFMAVKGDDWPTWEKFLQNDFTGISKEVVDEISNVKKFNWKNWLKLTNRTDNHPTPTEHLEYLDKAFTEFQISNDVRKWVAQIEPLVLNSQPISRELWTPSTMSRW